jgi:hypothetical protein
MLVGGGEGSKEMYSKLQRSSTKKVHEAKGIFSATSCTGLWNFGGPSKENWMGRRGTASRGKLHLGCVNPVAISERSTDDVGGFAAGTLEPHWRPKGNQK